MADTTPWFTRGRDAALGLAALIGSVAIPWATLESGKRQHSEQLARQYVELGVSILKSPQSGQAPELTSWAVRIVNHYGEVPMSAEAANQLRELKIPVAVPCSADPGPAPEYPDTDAALKAAPNLAEAVKLLLAGRALRIGREAVLDASISGCR